MSKPFDVIVVGVGTMGAAACYHLARRNVRTLGLEKFSIPHGEGAHHGGSRAFRLAYFEHADYVTLLKRAFENWRALEAETGLKILHATGGLYLGSPDSDLVGGSLKAAEMHHLEHRLLDREALRHDYPQFHLPESYVGVFESLAGYVRASRAVAAFADRSMREGAELHGHEPVVDWHISESGVVVKTQRDEYRADRVVFCGGAWTNQIVRDLGIELRVTRQVLGWVWPRDVEAFAAERFPVWAIDENKRGEDAGIHYGFPMMPDEPGLKIAHHWPGNFVDPDNVDRTVSDKDEATFRPLIKRVFPDANGPLIAMRTCLYTSSPDGHFIVDHHPSNERALVACGFSGHGFKFAGVVGELIADLAANNATDLPYEFLKLSRFA